MRSCLVIAAVLVAGAIGASTSQATTLTIPAGWEAVISGAQLNGCNANAYGYQVGSAANVQVAAKAAGCPASSANPVAGATIGPVSTAQTVRLYLSDVSCSDIFYSDGGGTSNHAYVSATNPYTILFNDGGPGCNEPGDDPPAPGTGNFTATLTIVAPPPTVTVTAPSVPAGQAGYFNSADLTSAGGHITVSVSAHDTAGLTVSTLACTDNGTAVTVSSPAGAGTATETGKVAVSSSGTHAIKCTATDSDNDSGSSGSANTATVKIDSNAPTVTVPASPVVTQARGLGGAEINSYAVSALDAEGDTPTITCTPAAPHLFPIGMTTVSCLATDQAGNPSATKTFVEQVTAPPVATASFGAVKLSGASGTVTVRCTGVAGQVCVGTLTATTQETKRGTKVVMVAAAKGSRAKVKPKATTPVPVATASYSIPAGSSGKVTLTLNRTGKALITRFYRVPVQLTLGGPVPHTVSRTATYAYTVVDTYTLYTGSSFSSCCFTNRLTDISFTFIPKGATLTERCRKGGCSPGHTTFKARGPALTLSPKFVVSLPYRAVVDFEITVPGEVGKVLELSNSGSTIAQRVLCLPPGVSTPRPCAIKPATPGA